MQKQNNNGRVAGLYVGVAELAYAYASEAYPARVEGSNPSSDTKKLRAPQLRGPARVGGSNPLSPTLLR